MDEPSSDAAVDATAHSEQAEVAALVQSNGGTDAREVAAHLTALRALGTMSLESAQTLALLLEHRSELFRDRDRVETLRLRAYLMVTLAETGHAQAARGSALDVLLHPDTRGDPMEMGAAVRVVSALGEDSRELAPEFLKLLGRHFTDVEFSLERFDPDFPRSEATTVRLEVIAGLARIGAADERTLESLRALAAEDPNADPRVAPAAAAALQAIADRQVALGGDSSAIAEAGSALPAPASCPALGATDVAYTDQSGATGRLADLLDRPTVLCFFYTRCTNDYKCTATIARLAQLERTLAEEGRLQDVRLLAVSFEPQFDDPARIARYGADRGVRWCPEVRGLQLDPAGLHRLLEEIRFPVGFQYGWVNTHGVEIVLLDAQARILCRYASPWSEAELLEDLRRALAQRS